MATIDILDANNSYLYTSHYMSSKEFMKDFGESKKPWSLIKATIFFSGDKDWRNNFFPNLLNRKIIESKTPIYPKFFYGLIEIKLCPKEDPLFFKIFNIFQRCVLTFVHCFYDIVGLPIRILTLPYRVYNKNLFSKEEHPIEQLIDGDPLLKKEDKLEAKKAFEKNLVKIRICEKTAISNQFLVTTKPICLGHGFCDPTELKSSSKYITDPKYCSY